MTSILLLGTNNFIYKNLKNFIKKQNLKYSVVNLKDNFFLKNEKEKVLKKLKNVKPKFCIVTSGLSGGILFNISHGFKILNYNVKIYHKIFNYLILSKVNNVFFISASCVYPKFNFKSINENLFLKGSLEETSFNYSVSKILGHAYCVSAIKKNLNYTCLVPATLYGPYIDSSRKNSHVINSLVEKFKNKKKIEIWGKKSTRREFIYIYDFLDAIFFINKRKIKEKIINIGVNKDYSIQQLVLILKNLTKYKGKILWKKYMPTGVKKKLLDSNKLFKFGWRPNYSLEEGLASMIKN